MAAGMKYWLLAVVAGFGVVASLSLPVRPPAGTKPDPRILPEAIRYQDLQNQVRLQQEIVARVDWLESSIAELREGAVVGEPSIRVGLSSELEGDRVESNLASRLVTLLPRRAEVDLGVFYHRVEGTPVDPRWAGRRFEYFVGQADGRPYCIRSLISSGSSGMGAADELGVCAFVLRYGLPGSKVSRWLKSGGFEWGAWSGEAVRRGREEALENEVALDGFDQRLRFAIFGVVAGWSLPPGVTRCLAGQIEACRDHFLYPTDGADGDMARELSEAVPELWVSGPSERSWYEELILSDLEADFGGERFTRYWTSELDVEAAFEDAFGLSVGEWMHEWFQRYTPRDVRSRRAGLGHGLQTMLVILAGLGVAVLRERKRKLA